ncbi:hypothetical protein [Paraburkholderia silvatlantica]|uniref:hypothetical protein n=1 Tax=Paraburkholderia silvatlantica TaxID=321895 RepID=UPI003752087A
MRRLAIADFFVRVATLIFVLIACLWLYFHFVYGQDELWQGNINLSAEVLPYHDDLKLLVVHVRTKNPRDVQFELNKEEMDSFELRARELPLNGAEGKVFNEEEGKLIARADLLKLAGGGYIFLPKAEMDDMQVFVVRAGSWISLTAEMKSKTGQSYVKENDASMVVYVSKTDAVNSVVHAR